MKEDNVYKDFAHARSEINASLHKIDIALADDPETIDVEYAEIEAQVAELRDLLPDLQLFCQKNMAEADRINKRNLEIEMRLNGDPRLPCTVSSFCDD